MLGFILVLLGSLFEVKYIKTLSLIRNKYFTLSLISLMLSVFNFFLFFIFSDNIAIDFEENSRILNDPLFWFSIALEVSCFLLVLVNYKNNPKNITAINFSFFISIALMPFLVYFGKHLGVFDNSLRIDFNNLEEIFLFSFTLLFLVFIYFFDKVKKHAINRKRVFFFVPFLLTLNLYLAINLMQEYSNFFFVSAISAALTLKFITLSFFKKENHKITRADFKNFGVLTILVLPASPLISFGLSILPVELGTVMKRLSQLISGVTFDLLEENKFNLKIKDIFAILGILVVSVYFY